MSSTRIPEHRCAACGFKMDATTCVTGVAVPRAGDISICVSCGALSIFTADLSLRDPTPEERWALAADPSVTEAQIARAYEIGDKFRRRR